MKKLLPIILLCIAFAACKHSDDSFAFEITGVHDVDMRTPDGCLLPVIIKQTGGKNQIVTLSVTDLPAGIKAVISPASGAPEFTSLIGFSNDFTTPPGNYPAVLTGTTAEGTKVRYTFNLQVPDSQYYTLGSARFIPDIAGKVLIATGQYYIQAYSSVFNTGVVVFFYGNKLPDSTGIYRIVAQPAKPDEVRVTSYSGINTYRATGKEGKYAIVNVQGEKISFSVPAIEVQSPDMQVTTTASALVSEQ